MRRIVSVLLALVLNLGLLLVQAQGVELSDTNPASNERSSFCCPTQEEIKLYQTDGTYEERLAFSETTAMNFSSRLVRNLTKALNPEAPAELYSYLPDDLSTGLGEMGLMPTSGTVRALVIIVNFADYTHTDTTQRVALQLQEVSDFYLCSSYGKLNLDYTVLQCAVEHDRAYYEDPDQDGSRNEYKGKTQLLTDALNQVGSNIDLNDYDSDADGFADAVYLYSAGPNTGWGSMWWSYVTNGFDEITRNDTTIKECCFVVPSGTGLVDTLKHESGHMLGLGDYYDNYSGFAANLIGSSDMMVGNVYDHNTFSKLLLGWIDQPQIITTQDKNVTIELRPFGSYPDMAIIYPNGQPGPEFFVVEYDTDGVFKQGCPGGIRVWRINATLDETGTRFRYGVHNGEIPLLECVNSGDENGFLELGRTIEDKNGLHYQSLLYPGDVLTPYTYPSTYIYGDEVQRFGEMQFSGVWVTDVSLSTKTATCTVRIDSAPEEKALTYTLKAATDNMLLFTLSFSAEVHFANENGITILHNAEPLSDINVVYNKRDADGMKRQVTITATDKANKIIGGEDYTLNVAEGTFISPWGVANPAISKTYTAVGFDQQAVIPKPMVTSFGSVSNSYLDSSGNPFYFCVEDGTTFVKQTYCNGEFKREVLLSEDSIDTFHASQLCNGTIVMLASLGNNTVGVYLHDMSGSFMRLGMVPADGFSWDIYEVKGGFLFHVSKKAASNYYYCNLSEGSITKYNGPISAYSLHHYGLAQPQYFYTSSYELMPLDDDFSIHHVLDLREAGIFSETEAIGSVVNTVDGGIVLFSRDTFNYGKNAWLATIFTSELKFVKKFVLELPDVIRLGEYGFGFHKAGNYYVITTSFSYNEDENTSLVSPVGTALIYDQDFNLIATYTIDKGMEQGCKIQNVFPNGEDGFIFDIWNEQYVVDGIHPRILSRSKEIILGADNYGYLTGNDSNVLWIYQNGELSVRNIPQGHTIFVALYDDSGRFTGVKLLTAEQLSVQIGNPDSFKLFWMGSALVPQGEAVTVTN